MSAILCARRDTDIGFFHQHAAFGLRRDAHMLQHGALAQHDLETDIAELGLADAFHQGQRRAVFQHQKSAHMA